MFESQYCSFNRIILRNIVLQLLLLYIQIRIFCEKNYLVDRVATGLIFFQTFNLTPIVILNEVFSAKLI